MTFNLIIIPVVIVATAVIGSRYVKQGIRPWYKELNKPKWTPSGRLIGEIWTFLYVLTGLAVLWYWNVPVVSWMHYIVGAILLVNAYLNATWNKTFFVDHNIAKALQKIKLLNLTTVIATILMAVDSPIAASMMLPYIVWVGIATKLTKEIMKMNQKPS